MQDYRKLLRELYEEQKSDLEITTISDCVIVSSKTLEPLLIFLFYLQSNMIYNDAANVNIIMRGYLTKGKFVHKQKKNLIVGEAYQKAVLGEKDNNFPRIEIDKRVVNEIKNPYDICVTLHQIKNFFKMGKSCKKTYTDHILEYKAFSIKSLILDILKTQNSLW